MSDDDENPLIRAQRYADELKAKQAAEQAKQTPPVAPVGATTPITDLGEKRRAAWLQNMLTHGAERLSAAPHGERNDELNVVAYTLGGIVHLGLDESAARALLYETALQTGLTVSETTATLQSGFHAGVSEPMTVELAERKLLNGTVVIDEDETTRDFWQARPLLSHLQAFARARRVSPWAMLGVELARAVAATPPLLVLPPLVGGYGSLNLFVGLVGISGSGKGGAERAGREAISMPHVDTLTVGSGEGISHSYVRRDRKGEQTPITDRMMFNVPEVDTLAAVAGRQGATLLPELRRAWSGEALGFAYADPTKRLLVEAHRYRMTLILGIQPGRARPLLDDADGGTPQRFLWLPAADREAPDVAPPTPEPWHWEPPSFIRLTHRTLTGLSVMTVCDLAMKTIDDATLGRLRRDPDALDGHALLSHLKTAAALALLDGRADVSDEDWLLAGTVMRVSQGTRERVAETLKDARRTRNRAQAEGYAERSLIVDEKRSEVEADHEERVQKRIVQLLQSGAWAARGELRRGVRQNHRHAFDDALAALLEVGTVTSLIDEKGVTRYALMP